ncbi:hypothetical protein [uncultured Shimia sp.]|uniref:hypothetical protein n=1 Tax=uncultured Shimia sp. TaxID=573152 RepID=UPI00261ED024|nr:hypothetical protein [uncultured Shimia sp.]
MLKGKARHELACSTCGAPLHELKQMPSSRRDAPREKIRVIEVAVSRERPKNKKKHKKRKSWSKKFKEELFDAIEDIFD